MEVLIIIEKEKRELIYNYNHVMDTDSSEKSFPPWKITRK